MGSVLGIIDDVINTAATFAQSFAEDVVAAGAQVLNSFINLLAGPAAYDKIIDEFSTQNSYLYNDDAYIDNLYNTDEIALNSLIKGTSVVDEIVAFYRKANQNHDFNLSKAMELQRGDTAAVEPGSTTAQEIGYYTPYEPQVQSNFDVGIVPGYDLDHVLSPVTLRVNNINLFEGEVSAEYAGTSGREANFTWHKVLEDD
ncbi:uncharacterized protein METZ01_LOCUS469518, partial [marine metagenome]